jgi:tetratricopeptide (TPR) repeat protein
MKKTALTILSLLLLVTIPLISQNNSADEEYIKAMTTNDVNQRVQLLKAYVQKYAGQGTTYENFANAYLCILPFKKTPREAVEYGEKAISLGGLDDFLKYNVYITTATSYTQLGQNLEKAKNYASQAIQIAKSNKTKKDSEHTPAQWTQFEGAGYYVQAQAQEKAKDYSGALSSYISSYDILKNKQIAQSVTKLGKTLYNAKSYREAEKALKFSSSMFNDFGSTYLYAKTLHRNNKKDEALAMYKKAYAKEKNGDIAYNVGIILANKSKTNAAVANEAIQFLLDASFLSAANSKKAMSLAENLFFFTANKDLKYNEKVQEINAINKKIEDLTNAFNQKFGEKEEEDLTDQEKREMEKILSDIDFEQKEVEKIQKEQEAALEKFSALIESTKRRLGIS